MKHFALKWAVKKCSLLSLMSQTEISSLNRQKYFGSSVNYGYMLFLQNNYENGPLH